MSFTKLDSGIIDSSVWSEPSDTRVVWITFLAKKDSNGFVAASNSGMIRSCNVPEDSFYKAIKTLESADPDSRTPDYDGRRIEKVEGGWIVLNHKKYRDYSYSGNPEAIRKRVYRSRDKMGHVPKVAGHSVSVSVSESVSDINSEEIKNIKKTKPTIEMVKDYCLERKNSVDPERWFSHYESNGWMVGKNKMKEWRAAVRTWERNSFENKPAKRYIPGTTHEIPEVAL